MRVLRSSLFVWHLGREAPQQVPVGYAFGSMGEGCMRVLGLSTCVKNCEVVLQSFSSLPVYKADHLVAAKILLRDHCSMSNDNPTTKRPRIGPLLSETENSHI